MKTGLHGKRDIKKRVSAQYATRMNSGKRGMKRMLIWRWGPAALLLAVGGTGAWAEAFAIQSFDGSGRLSYYTLNDGTNYNYRVEWAPSPDGPWNDFGSSGANWLGARPQAGGHVVTNTVPMCYRVVATRGDYLIIDISGGASAATYPVTYYRTLADVPGVLNSDTYKMTNILMRLIPKGTFMMGSPTGELGRYNNETQHEVALTRDFYVGVFEVTQRQWELVMGDRPSYFTIATYYAIRPVEQVSYYDIREDPSNSDDPAVDWPNNRAVNEKLIHGQAASEDGIVGSRPSNRGAMGVRLPGRHNHCDKHGMPWSRTEKSRFKLSMLHLILTLAVSIPGFFRVTMSP